MAEDKPDTSTPAPPVQTGVIENHDAPIVYANMCGIQVTPEEVSLNFAQRHMDDPNQGDSVVIVYTSLHHAKRLAYALLQSLKGYEESFGEIQTDMMERLKPEARERIISAIQNNGTNQPT